MNFDTLPIPSAIKSPKTFALYCYISESTDFARLLHNCLDYIKSEIKGKNQIILNCHQELLIKQARNEIKYYRHQRKEIKSMYKTIKSLNKRLNNPDLIEFISDIQNKYSDKIVYSTVRQRTIAYHIVKTFKVLKKDQITRFELKSYLSQSFGLNLQKDKQENNITQGIRSAKNRSGILKEVAKDLFVLNLNNPNTKRHLEKITHE